MTTIALGKRLVALEACQPARSAQLGPAGLEDAAYRYARTLTEPPDPRHAAYIAGCGLREIAADTDAMLRGAPAPWLREA